MNIPSVSNNKRLLSEYTEMFIAELEKRVVERTASLSKENKELKEEIARGKTVLEQTNKSFKEKIILFKEIHHTVKNNMQVISSLLNIQADYIDDEKSLEVLRESRNRIHSMALVHEKFY